MSANLLRRMDEGSGVFVRNFPWQGSDGGRLPISSLGSRTLCKRHNEDLSALDQVAGRLVDHLERIPSEFAAGETRGWFWALNGHDVERWLLKSLCGLLSSKSGRAVDGSPLLDDVPEEWVRILFGERLFPSSWGLYVGGSIGHETTMAPKLLEFAPVSGDGSVVGVSAGLSGFELVLIMAPVGETRTGAITSGSIYRPGYIEVSAAGVSRTLYFHWDQPSERAGIQMAWSPAVDPPAESGARVGGPGVTHGQPRS
jgi:hypothetical protein